MTGEPREIQYTHCKIVGNGSFGVVFQTKLSPSGEDAAIKRVLQDKRFKVWRIRVGVAGWEGLAVGWLRAHTNLLHRTVSCKSCASYGIRTL